MKTKQYITQTVELDMGHRVMHEKVRCSSMHGHRIKIELTFSFQMVQEIGYYIDFQEIKRIAGGWLNDFLDHGFVVNPEDHDVIEACKKTDSKLYIMSLNGPGVYCNPTGENISREIWMAMTILFAGDKGLKLEGIRYYETPNCIIDTMHTSVNPEEFKNFKRCRAKEIKAYAKDKGRIEHDVRKS